MSSINITPALSVPDILLVAVAKTLLEKAFKTKEKDLFFYSFYVSLPDCVSHMNHL
jgi:hypothetical protein